MSPGPQPGKALAAQLFVGLSLSPYGVGRPGNHSHEVALPWPPSQPEDIALCWLLPHRPAWVLVLLPHPNPGSSGHVAAQVIYPVFVLAHGEVWLWTQVPPMTCMSHQRLSHF